MGEKTAGQANDRIAQSSQDGDLYDHVIYRCVVGSRAYGLARPDSDVDTRGAFLPPADLHWSLAGVPEQLEDKVSDTVFWELQKFLGLALKANPNILECLFTPHVEYVAPIMQPILDHRQCFVSKVAYVSYRGFAMSQYTKLQNQRAKGKAMVWKDALHCIRTLLDGIHLMKAHRPQIVMEPWRDRLLALRHGEMSWGAFDTWRGELLQALESAYDHTDLPDQPDVARIEALLIEARAEQAAQLPQVMRRVKAHDDG